MAKFSQQFIQGLLQPSYQQGLFTAAQQLGARPRQMAQQRMKKRGLQCQCIRCREVKRQKLKIEDLRLTVETYETDGTTEHFLSFVSDEDKIAGFLRLSFPDREQELPLPELADHAMIREVHVYGPAVSVGDESQGEAQHIGLGSQLVEKAKMMAHDAGYGHIAVISAIGTREYYAKHGFAVNGLYMTTQL